MIVLSVNAKQNVSARANINSVLMMIAFFQFIHNNEKRYENKEQLLLTSDFNSGSGFSVVVVAPTDDADADADDAASGAALVFVVVVVVVVFSAVSAFSAATLILLDFCLNDVDVLFVPPLFFDDDAVA